MSVNQDKDSLVERPRERMKASARPEELSDETLLAVLLRTGTPGCDAEETARRILGIFGSVGEMMVDTDWRTFRANIDAYNRIHHDAQIRGIGETRAMELAAALELGRRAVRNRVDWRQAVIKANSARTAYEMIRPLVTLEEQECFFVIPIDSDYHPLSRPLRLYRGTHDRAPVHSREVFREAVRWGAYALLVAHNHPCGDPTPSEDDIALTRRLVDASHLLAIPLLDHIVIGSPDSCDGRGFVSIRASGAVDF